MLQAGDLIAARYRIERRLGQGGFATVFQAVHVGTERCVALKVLSDRALEVADTLEKFQLEAKVSARVKNQHIVEVFDAGFDSGRQCAFLVMELLEGETLASRIRGAGRLEPAQTLRLLRELADGLDAAHGYRDAEGRRSPIIHRDLKPENLFIHRRPDGSETLKILDYGIAKVSSEQSLQLSFAVRGTPPFMAPEQIQPARVSPQTDIWALGLIVHLMLTGQHYWRGMSRVGCTAPELFEEILSPHRDLPRSRLGRRGFGVQLPSAFDAWLLRCLEPVPARRFASAGAAIDALALAVRARSAEPQRPRSETLPEYPRPVITQAYPAASKRSHAPAAKRSVSRSRHEPTTAGSLPNVAREGSSVLPRRASPAARLVAIGLAAMLAASGWLAWSLRGTALAALRRTGPAPTRAAPAASPGEPSTASFSLLDPVTKGPRLAGGASATAPASAPGVLAPSIAPVHEPAAGPPRVSARFSPEPPAARERSAAAARAPRLAARSASRSRAPGPPSDVAPPAAAASPSLRGSGAAPADHHPPPAIDPYAITPSEIAPAAARAPR